jgi:hypothetical protein
MCLECQPTLTRSLPLLGSDVELSLALLTGLTCLDETFAAGGSTLRQRCDQSSIFLIVP